MNDFIPYKLSKDYDRLRRLLNKGYPIVCYVDYRFHGETKDIPASRDICRAKLHYNGKSCAYYDFSVRGTSYISWFYQNAKEYEKYPTFESLCEKSNVEFIDIDEEYLPLIHKRT